MVGGASLVMLIGVMLAVIYGWMYSTEREPPGGLLKAGVIAVVLGMGIGGFLGTDSLTDNVPQEDEIELAELKAQTKLSPSDEMAWLRYANKAEELGYHQESAMAWKKVLQINGMTAAGREAARRLVAFLMKNDGQNGVQEARQILQELFSKGERDFSLHELYADLCMKSGDWSQANKTYDALLMRLSIDDKRFQRIAAAASEAARKERETHKDK